MSKRLPFTPAEILQLQYAVAFNRDEQSYKKIFLHYHPALVRFAYSITNNVDVAEELVGNALLHVWDMEERLCEIQQLKIYLFIVVKNGCAAWEAHHKTQAAPEAVALTSLYAGDGPLYPTAAFTRVMQAALQELPYKSKLAYLLVRPTACTCKEAAAVLGVSVHALETHLQLALTRMGTLVKEHLLKNK
ncbi:RNA polymerase sigma factor [Deminuibacter soli]|uniref:RNA polymerase sigma-70 factor n=1 Tax=Deminuibacter soli TaxID=2291815 RepID=A0A3E1NCJ0_9BACT|nr:sigma factor-like helix-turn-helix DNA-binding protein [Deminuibacter soli]RFM25673.1 hypothetical protein DXN05_24000 [Deminuibacter soli]